MKKNNQKWLKNQYASQHHAIDSELLIKLANRGIVRQINIKNRDNRNTKGYIEVITTIPVNADGSITNPNIILDHLSIQMPDRPKEIKFCPSTLRDIATSGKNKYATKLYVEGVKEGNEGKIDAALKMLPKIKLTTDPPYKGRGVIVKISCNTKDNFWNPPFEYNPIKIMELLKKHKSLIFGYYDPTGKYVYACFDTRDYYNGQIIPLGWEFEFANPLYPLDVKEIKTYTAEIPVFDLQESEFIYNDYSVPIDLDKYLRAKSMLSFSTIENAMKKSWIWRHFDEKYLKPYEESILHTSSSYSKARDEFIRYGTSICTSLYFQNYLGTKGFSESEVKEIMASAFKSYGV